MMGDSSHYQPGPGCCHTGKIEATAAYTMDEFKRQLSIGDHAWVTLRNKGLPIIKLGRQVFVRGADFIEWLGNQND